MADLGTISSIWPGADNRPSPLLPITDYNINRGRPLGTVVTTVNRPYQGPLELPGNYIIRQLRILYRQLWPSHGQRFPQ